MGSSVAGGRGRRLLEYFLEVEGVGCAALCDVDDGQTGRALRSLGTAAGAPLHTRDFRRVLDLKELDAVIVATPDHWHALQSVAACQAGKDIYVEKPLSLTIQEGRTMVRAARLYQRVVQVGTQQRSAPQFTQAVETVKSGRLGRIRLVRTWAYLDWKGATPKAPDGPPPAGVDYNLWLGPARRQPFNPNRFHFTFRWYWDYSGGLMTDWGAHMVDIANWGMGVRAPVSAFSAGGKFAYPDDAMETPDTQQVTWAFPHFSMIWEHALGVGRGPEAREHGVAFHGEDGVLVVDRFGWEVFPETRRIDSRRRTYKAAGLPRQRVGRDYTPDHVRNFLDCMRSRETPVADVEIGHNSVIACHLGNIAQRLGRQVRWDVDRERVIDDPEAGGSHDRPELPASLEAGAIAPGSAWACVWVPCYTFPFQFEPLAQEVPWLKKTVASGLPIAASSPRTGSCETRPIRLRAGPTLPPAGSGDPRGQEKAAGSASPPIVGQDGPEPEMDFPRLVLSLTTTAMLQLGLVPDPASQKVEKNLPAARQTIDILEILKEKTQGNLKPEETQLLDRCLHDLKMSFVQSSRKVTL